MLQRLNAQSLLTGIQQDEFSRLELAELDLKLNHVTADTLQRIRSKTSKDPALQTTLLHMLMNG